MLLGYRHQSHRVGLPAGILSGLVYPFQNFPQTFNAGHHFTPLR
jgi:hypothetical protein